jgi:hypothetical protein
MKNDGPFSCPSMVSSQKRNLKFKNRGERRKCHSDEETDFSLERHVPSLQRLDERPPQSAHK